jgi:predicted RNA-binding protein associated with RNAse of E/G family
MTRRGQRLRWPDRVSEQWEEVALGEDEYGVWGCLPPLASVEISNGDVVRFRYPVLLCYPKDRWWVAIFRPGSERIAEIHHPDGTVHAVESPEQIYVHMATPAALTEEGVSFFDLVLDVIRLPDRTVTVLDEDELESHVAEGSIPLDAVANARLACDEIAEMLREDIEPFGEVWTDWLDRFLGEKQR